MGYYLFDGKKSYAQKVKDTICRFVIPSIIGFAVYYLLNDWVIGSRSLWECVRYPKLSIYAVIRMALANDSGEIVCPHFWYVYAYVGIILAFPLLKLMCEYEPIHNKIRRYIMCLCAITLIIGNVLWSVNQLFHLQLGLYNYSVINEYMLYVLLGYELSHMQENSSAIGSWIQKQKEQSKRWYRIGTLTIFVGFNLYVCAMEFFAIKAGIPGQFYYENSFAYYFSAVGLFLFLIEVPLCNEKINKVIRFVADKTLYIYIYHYLFTQYLEHHPNTWSISLPPVRKYILTVLVIFSISFVIAMVIEVIERIIIHISKGNHESA